LVDIDSEMAKLFFSDLHYITTADYEKAKEYVSNPEEYDFNQILEWS